MRLPFWAVKVLQKKNAAAIKLPRHFEYKGKFRQQLGLDPSRVNLKEKDPHFFLRSLQLSRLCAPNPSLPPDLPLFSLRRKRLLAATVHSDVLMDVVGGAVWRSRSGTRCAWT